MVNPVKFISRATGLSNLLDRPETPPPASTAPTQAQAAPAPQPAPILGQEPAPKRTTGRAQTYGPAVIGGGLSGGSVGEGGGKTLLGQ